MALAPISISREITMQNTLYIIIAVLLIIALLMFILGRR